MDAERPWAVFDIDGVVADPGHRLGYLHAVPPDWDGFFAEVDGDAPLAEGMEMAGAEAATCEMVWFTGRPERTRRQTIGWLERHGLPVALLLMRPDTDDRPASVLKAEWLSRLAARRPIALVVDDNTAVVTHLLGLGWPVRHARWQPIGAALRVSQEQLGRT